MKLEQIHICVMETAINYSLNDKVSLGFSNTYTEDPVNNNVLSVTIGVKW